MGKLRKEKNNSEIYVVALVAIGTDFIRSSLELFPKFVPR